MTHHELAAMLVGAGLRKYAPVIIGLARASVRIEATRSNHRALALGASRFGGVPDLPPGFEWPRYEERPLAFLAQIDLSAFPHPDDSELPRHGSLAFFYEVEGMKWGFDPIDRGCARVVWFETTPGSLLPTFPAVSTPRVECFAPCTLSFAPDVDLPDSRDRIFGQVYDEMTDDEHSRYSDLASSLRPATSHHLLGHPQLVQGDMRLECELASNGIYVGDLEAYKNTPASSLRGAHDWQLLLQVDTDEEHPGWCWGDVGRIYFWIRSADLAARRFDRTWLVLQCY